MGVEEVRWEELNDEIEMEDGEKVRRRLALTGLDWDGWNGVSGGS